MEEWVSSCIQLKQAEIMQLEDRKSGICITCDELSMETTSKIPRYPKTSLTSCDSCVPLSLHLSSSAAQDANAPAISVILTDLWIPLESLVVTFNSTQSIINKTEISELNPKSLIMMKKKSHSSDFWHRKIQPIYSVKQPFSSLAM